MTRVKTAYAGKILLLTFLKNQFILRNGTDKILSLKAAVRFRPYADDIAERVFNRTLVKTYKAPSTPLPNFLDPHQVDGVNWILTRSRSYLAHAPGAGKTAQAIVAAIMSEGPGQILFIVPPSLTINWEREINKWSWHKDIIKIACEKYLWPKVSIITSSALKHEVDWNAQFIICPDSMLTKGWVYENLENRNWKLIAVDEASRFKEPTSARTQALFGGGLGKNGKPLYYGLVQQAKHTVLLDGSPMPNRPMELWAPTSAMAPETIDFMTPHEFGVKYCAGHFVDDGKTYDWNYRGASNQAELKARLQKSFMHVVTEDKLSHPERLRSIVFTNNEDKTVRDLRSWEQKHLRTLKLKDVDEEMSQGEIATHRQKLGLSKVDWVSKYVSERLENESEYIILFAWHREVCGLLYDRLKRFALPPIFGGTSAEERENVFRAFQNGSRRLIIGNISAMGRGHNLQRSTRVVFAEYSWTDETNKQAEKRASRRGSVHSMVRCDYVAVQGTLDEVVLNAVFTKEKNVKRIIG